MAGSMRGAAVVIICALFALGCHDEEEGAAASGASSFEDVAWTAPSGATVRFVDGTVSGFAGCNRFTASYEASGNELKIGTAATTQMACDPASEAAEREYLASLERVRGWRAEGDELLLLDEGGEEVLRFRAASLVGEWTATMFLQRDAVSSPLPDTEVTANFAADGKLSGSSGCNTYSATYQADRGRIKISEPISTFMACEEAIMEQEQAYLAALPLATHYTVEGSTLSLLTEQGTFVAIYQDG
jgi:heat shock protein HslJ